MKKNPYPGKFSVFEGIDGSGKSTQAAALADFMKNTLGQKVYETSEPTASMIGGLIRSQIAGDWKSSNECLQLLFSADRLYHLEKEILPMLKSGIHVICDRYFFSTVAYGGATGGNKEWLLQMQENIISPDITFLLRISARVGIERIHANRHGIKLFDKEDLLKKVAENYDSLAQQFKDTTVILDGEQPEKQIAAKVQRIIQERFL